MTYLVELDQATKRFPTSRGGVHTAVPDIDLARERRRVRRRRRADRLRQVHHALAGLGAGAAVRRAACSVNGEPVRGIPAASGTCSRPTPMLPWRTRAGQRRLRPPLPGRVEGRGRGEQARDWVARVGLAGFEDYYMHQLSGGMRKRVALAQTLVNEPSILLMDEPFSALDVQTRALMQDELLRLWSGTGAAVIFVTHDLEEAIALADRVVVMTASPARSRTSSRSPLDRPRNVEEIRITPEFIDDLPRDLGVAARRGRDTARKEPPVSLATLSTQVRPPLEPSRRGPREQPHGAASSGRGCAPGRARGRRGSAAGS